MFIGCLSFQVKEYRRPPLRCFDVRCQRFGHLAATCRGKRRCAKCGEDHDVQNCKVSDPKCCNCGGSHHPSFKECCHFIKAKQVQDVKEKNRISYVEALKKVEGPCSSSHFAKAPIGGAMVPSLPQVAAAHPDEIVIKKESLLAYIVDVVYATREKKSRSDIIKFVAEASVMFLGLKGYIP